MYSSPFAFFCSVAGAYTVTFCTFVDEHLTKPEYRIGTQDILTVTQSRDPKDYLKMYNISGFYFQKVNIWSQNGVCDLFESQILYILDSLVRTVESLGSQSVSIRS